MYKQCVPGALSPASQAPGNEATAIPVGMKRYFEEPN